MDNIIVHMKNGVIEIKSKYFSKVIRVLPTTNCKPNTGWVIGSKLTDNWKDVTCKTCLSSNKVKFKNRTVVGKRDI